MTTRTTRARVRAHTRHVNGRTVRVRAHARRVDWSPLGREAVAVGVAGLATLGALFTTLQAVLSLTTTLVVTLTAALAALVAWRQRHRVTRRTRVARSGRARRRPPETRVGRRDQEAATGHAAARRLANPWGDGPRPRPRTPQ